MARRPSDEKDQAKAAEAVSLNRSGRAIWELCDGSLSVNAIIDRLQKLFGADPQLIEQDVLSSLSELAAHDLVQLSDDPVATPVTHFVVAIEDWPGFHWQVAIWLESFREKLPTGWATLVVVCNDHKPISNELERILAVYETKYVTANNNSSRFPVDFGYRHSEFYGPLNRVEALAVAADFVKPQDVICILDCDTFLYGDIRQEIMPKTCAAPWNWHIAHSPFFSTVPSNGGGIDISKLLEAMGFDPTFDPAGVNIFVTGEVAKNQKFIADCYRFAQVLFLLGRIKGIGLVWMAEMPCFALAMKANGIACDVLKDPCFMVPSCDEKEIQPGSIYHYYSDPADFGRYAFRGSTWYKQAYRDRNFLLTDYRDHLSHARSANATDHERYFFELAEGARKRIYMYATPLRLLENQKDVAERVPSLGLGFRKVKLDPSIHRRLVRHLTDNRHKFVSEPANDYLLTENQRARPTLIFHDEAFNQKLLSDLMDLHREWSGRDLTKAACYGIRVYQNGSYLLNHLDRLKTHVVSSTICVDHRLESPWPLYIEDADGNPNEIHIEPGEMVFFEGALLKHGRPYAMRGEFYANIFLHYTPLDWSLQLAEGRGHRVSAKPA